MVTLENPQTGELVSELSRLTGESVEQAVQLAVKERLERLAIKDRQAYIARLREISARVAAMPILDERTPDEIIGYNEHGTFD